MATKFDDLYKQYFELTDDLDIKKVYTTDMSYKVLWDYLQYSISIFGDFCFKNLYNYTPFQRLTYNFIGDGITKSFILNPIPPVGCDFFISEDLLESDDYSFNSITNEIDFSVAPLKDVPIYMASYIIGEFVDDLNVQEINLLAELMTIPFKKNKLNKTILLNQLVYSSDFSTFSPSAHIKEVRNTIEYDEKNLMKRIKSYCWKQNKNNIDILHGSGYSYNE